MKRLSAVVVSGLMFLPFCNDIEAAQQKVRFRVPGIICVSSGIAASSAAKSAEGVIAADENPNDSTLTVVFDDAMITVQKLMEVMKNADFPVKGEAEYLK